MQKLDSKRIDGLLKQLGNAGAAAMKALNEMTDGAYKDSPLATDPVSNIGQIGRILQQAQQQLKLHAKYEGMDEKQISEAKAAERTAEKADLQQSIQEKLASRQPKEPEPTEEPESQA